jgi:hypothetical protein
LYFPKFCTLLEVSRGFVFPEVFYLARSFPMFCISRSFLDCSKFPEVFYLAQSFAKFIFFCICSNMLSAYVARRYKCTSTS